MPKRTERTSPIVTKDNWPETLADLGIGLIDDYHALRQGRISVKQAQAGAKLAEQALRTVHLSFMGLKYISEQSKQVEARSVDPKEGE